ncbi:hypothetical protein HK101_001432 [Irineochytrium annulatum]|nr:hypothetical protein HK101_001432 [Irineochytrium annulatum]
MASHREEIFVEGLWVDKTTLADDKQVPEIGLTSAPLASIAFHYAEYCRKYNDDFMLCKNESSDPAHCLKEGRRVTRCALSLINKIKENCDVEWNKHWQCLDVKNQYFWKCRSEERAFNDCVFNKLGIKKVIPETPEGQTQVHLLEKPLIK